MAFIQYSDGFDGHLIRLGEDEVIIGQHRTCTIRFKAPRVSKHHARISKNVAGCWVEDLGSEDGTWVDGIRVERHRLAHGDKVTCGGLVLQYFEE